MIVPSRLFIDTKDTAMTPPRDSRHIRPEAMHRDLLVRVRAGLLVQHTTLAEWCRHVGVHPSAVRQAIYGTWAGPKGRAVRAQVLKAAGVKEAA